MQGGVNFPVAGVFGATATLAPRAHWTGTRARFSHSDRCVNSLESVAANGAATVGMGLEHARSDPAFQSEKTGSTPVGSAKIPTLSS